MITPVKPARRPQRQAQIRKNVSGFSGSMLQYNILCTYEQATDSERHTGERWYRNANTWCRRNDVLPGVLAAFSPMTRWETNKQRARDFTRTGKTEGFAEQIAKADAIRKGDDPRAVLGGRKVRSFHYNIAFPRRAGAVTIDRHAWAVATGNENPRALERLGVYETVAAAYRATARIMTEDLLPHELQAITWLAHRRLKEEALDLDRRTEEKAR